MAVLIGSAREHEWGEGRKLIPLMESICIRHGGEGPGRGLRRHMPIQNITCASLNRTCLDRKGIRQQIPESPQKRARPGRPRGFDRPVYHGIRYNVERFFGWMENYRKITIRYERIPNLFLSLIQLACIMILWRVLK